MMFPTQNVDKVKRLRELFCPDQKPCAINLPIGMFHDGSLLGGGEKNGFRCQLSNLQIAPEARFKFAQNYKVAANEFKRLSVSDCTRDVDQGQFHKIGAMGQKEEYDLRCFASLKEISEQRLVRQAGTYVSGQDKNANRILIDSAAVFSTQEAQEKNRAVVGYWLLLEGRWLY